MLIKAQFKVKLFYDIVSPYSWLAFESLLRYKKHWSKAEIELIPCSIKHVFEKSGNTAPLFNPLKASYIVKDAQRAGEIYKVSCGSLIKVYNLTTLFVVASLQPI